MLVLARNVEEKIRIGTDILIHVLSIKNGVVRLGITAPVDIPIKRIELDKEGAEIPVPKRDVARYEVPQE